MVESVRKSKECGCLIDLFFVVFGCCNMVGND